MQNLLHRNYSSYERQLIDQGGASWCLSDSGSARLNPPFHCNLSIIPYTHNYSMNKNDLWIHKMHSDDLVRHKRSLDYNLTRQYKNALTKALRWYWVLSDTEVLTLFLWLLFHTHYTYVQIITMRLRNCCCLDRWLLNPNSECGVLSVGGLCSETVNWAATLHYSLHTK